jgi:hypothetical protein
VVLLVMMVLAIIVALTLVGPRIVGEIRQMTYCMERQQESVC